MMLAWLLMLSAAASLPQGRFVDWPHDKPGARMRAGELTLVNATRPCDRARDKQGPDRCWVPGVRVERAGRSVMLTGAPTSIATIAVGPMIRGGRSAIVLSSWTGGAHCCQVYDVALPERGGWRTTRITWHPPGSAEWGAPYTEFDGELIGFPRDIDGDGIPDFVLSDDRFDYAFGSYAGSGSPPVILNFVDGRWIDVSARPGFADLVRADEAKWRSACLDPKGVEHAGVCAAYAADAARLGRLASVWSVVLAHGGHDQGAPGWDFHRCAGRFHIDSCPSGPDEGYPTYDSALVAFLMATGYWAGGRL